MYQRDPHKKKTCINSTILTTVVWIVFLFQEWLFPGIDEKWTFGMLLCVCLTFITALFWFDYFDIQ
jgi:hypothetical protein